MFEPRRRPGFFSSMLFIALMSGPPRFRSRDQFASLTGQVDWSVMLSMAIYGIALLWLGHKVASLLLRRAGLSGVTTSHVLAMACVLGLAGSVLVSPAPLLTLYRVLQIGVVVDALGGLSWAVVDPSRLRCGSHGRAAGGGAMAQCDGAASIALRSVRGGNRDNVDGMAARHDRVDDP